MSVFRVEKNKGYTIMAIFLINYKTLIYLVRPYIIISA